MRWSGAPARVRIASSGCCSGLDAGAVFELEIGLDQTRAQRVGVGIDGEYAVRGERGDDAGTVVEELLGDHLLVQAGRVGGAQVGRSANVRITKRDTHPQVVAGSLRDVGGQGG